MYTMSVMQLIFNKIVYIQKIYYNSIRCGAGAQQNRKYHYSKICAQTGNHRHAEINSNQIGLLHSNPSFVLSIDLALAFSLRLTTMADGAAANGSGPRPHRESTVSDSLGLVTSMETYKQRLPRRRKKASDGCWNLTCYSWTFLLLAFLQGTPSSVNRGQSRSIETVFSSSLDVIAPTHKNSVVCGLVGYLKCL